MPDGQDRILSLRGVKTWFPVRAGVFKKVVGHVKAVDGVDLDVVRGEILVLEPRRVAARAAAARMAEERGEAVGATIGFQVRLERRVSAATRVRVVTEGIAVRRLVGDPLLEGVGAVVLDEIHERSLDVDLALALCRQVQREVRPDLRIVAMSATLDTDRLAAWLDARVIRSEGRAFPVAMHHLPRPDDRPVERQVADGVRPVMWAMRSARSTAVQHITFE